MPRSIHTDNLQTINMMLFVKDKYISSRAYYELLNEYLILSEYLILNEYLRHVCMWKSTSAQSGFAMRAGLLSLLCSLPVC